MSEHVCPDWSVFNLQQTDTREPLVGHKLSPGIVSVGHGGWQTPPLALHEADGVVFLTQQTFGPVPQYFGTIVPALQSARALHVLPWLLNVVAHVSFIVDLYGGLTFALGGVLVCAGDSGFCMVVPCCVEPPDGVSITLVPSS